MHINRRALPKNLIIILVLLYSIMPVVARFISSTFSTYFYMVVILVLFAFIVFANARQSLNRNVYLLFPFVVWQILMMFVTREPIVVWGYQALLACLPVVLGVYILQYRQGEMRFFSKLICVAFVVTIITTIVGLQQYPDAARWLAAVSSSTDELLVLYEWKNIGGYNLVYSVVLLYPLLIFAYKQKKIGIVWASGLSVGIFVMLLMAEYTTALLLFLLTTTLFFVKRNLRGRDVVILISIAFMLCIVFSDSVSEFLFWLGEQLDSDTFTPRLYALAGGRTGLENAEDNRLELYTMSFNTFLRHPLLGTFLNGGFGSGGHSFILDTLAQFGLVGAMVMYFMYKRIYAIFYRPLKNEKGYGYVLWTFVQTILLSCINTGMWLYVLALYVPILVYTIYGKVEKR